MFAQIVSVFVSTTWPRVRVLRPISPRRKWTHFVGGYGLGVVAVVLGALGILGLGQ